MLHWLACLVARYAIRSPYLSVAKRPVLYTESRAHLLRPLQFVPINPPQPRAPEYRLPRPQDSSALRSGTSIESGQGSRRARRGRVGALAGAPPEPRIGFHASWILARAPSSQATRLLAWGAGLPRPGPGLRRVVLPITLL